MVNVIVIGDQRFYHDSARTRASMGHIIASALTDMEQSIAMLARKFAPGHLGESVGSEHAVPVGGNLYRAEVGVRNMPRHAKFVHEGTGMFGPLHRPYTIHKRQTHIGPEWGIDRTGRPNPAVGNVFKIPAGNGRGFSIEGMPYYFRKEVTITGQRPQPYLTEAFELAKRTEVPIRVKRLAHDIVRG